MKSARRDPRAIDYGGYMLTDARDGRIVLGASPTAFSASLDDVETYLRSGAIYKKRDAEPAASA